MNIDIFFSPVNSLKSIKTAQNAIYAALKENRGGRPGCSNNLAEECYQAHAMLLPDGNKYVQSIHYNQTNRPNLVLYGDEHISFINAHCGTNSLQPVILGVVRVICNCLKS